MDGAQADSSILLLNTTFEPLAVLNLRRALKLLFSKKALPIEESNMIVHTVNKQIIIPSVIQITYFIRKPFTRPKFSKKAIFMRDSGRCQYCGTYTHKPTIDHIIPKSKKGKNDWVNVVTACPECNNKKGDRTLKEAKMDLIRHPFEPKFIIYSLSISQSKLKHWEKYFTQNPARNSIGLTGTLNTFICQ